MSDFHMNETDLKEYETEIDEAIRKLTSLKEKFKEIKEKEVFKDRIVSIQKNIDEISKKLSH
jgi:chromosome segregation ATPase